LSQRGVLERVAAAAERHGALEQALEAGREDRAALVDGVLGVAQRMGQTELVLPAMAGLRGIAVADPDLGHRAPERLDDHCRGPAVGDDVIDGGARQQDPLPPRLAAHPRRGLVGGDDLGLAHLGGDGLGLLGQRPGARC
jgi:hypothetical protein